MFEELSKAFEPESILVVVEKHILQSLMQGFFFKEKTGMALLYDVPNLSCDEEGVPLYYELEPFDKENPRNREHFNAFCREFRTDRASDRACIACDRKAARLAFNTPHKGNLREFDCHMGLKDLTYQISFGGRVRAVLFAGQLVNQADDSIARIRGKVQTSYADRAATLEPLIEPNARDSSNMRRFIEGFASFAKSMEETVRYIYEARLNEAIAQALVKINAAMSGFFSETESLNTQGESAQNMAPRQNAQLREVLDGLENFLHGIPLAFLVRRHSRYCAIAVSQGIEDAFDETIAVAKLVNQPENRWTTIGRNTILGSHLQQRLLFPEGQDYTLFRIDTSNSTTRDLSVILALGGGVDPRYRGFLKSCCEAIAYPAHISLLFDRLRRQQEAFQHEVSFTGHFIKTPIQSALYGIQHLADEKDETKRQQLARDTEKRLLVSLFDAMVSQTAHLNAHERFDLARLLEDIVHDIESIARQRNVRVSLMIEPPEMFRVNAVKSHIRVALTNLIDNAVKYSFRDYEVRIRVQHISDYDVMIDIEDIGEGFPLEKKKALFRFGSRASGEDKDVTRHGFGLGLVQAKQFIEECGGSLDIESEPWRPEDPGEVRRRVNVQVTFPL